MNLCVHVSIYVDGRGESMDTTTTPLPTPSTDPSRVLYDPSMSAGYNSSRLVSMEEVDSISSEQYTIATHFVKVKRSGTLTDVTTLWDLVGTEAVSGSLDSVLDSRPGFDRLPSINAFDKVCYLNCIVFSIVCPIG